MASSYTLLVYKDKDPNGKTVWFLSRPWAGSHVGPMSKAALFLKMAEVINGLEA